jgi:hypothetical protein
MTSNDTGGWTADTFTALQFFLRARGVCSLLDTLYLLATLLHLQQPPRHAVAQTDGRERKLLTILDDISMLFDFITVVRRILGILVQWRTVSPCPFSHAPSFFGLVS